MAKNSTTRVSEEAIKTLTRELKESLQTKPKAAAKTDGIRFYAEHRPVLKAGTYRVTAEQTLVIPNEKNPQLPASGVNEKTNSLEQHFLIGGPRFGLKKDDIQSVYPPAGVTGDFNFRLPQISFNRATLPWELPFATTKPWICLILFKSKEAPEVEKLSIKELTRNTDDVLNPDKKVNVIKVPDALKPTDHDLLTHTRRGTETSAVEKAFVLGHRLPRDDGEYVAHLISLKDTKAGRYISLHHWTFSCRENKTSFDALMATNTQGALRLPIEGPDRELALPGYVPLPYFMRRGHSTLSLYRGPMVPIGQSGKYDDTQDYLQFGERRFLNRTKAVAFQLGQMLTVANQEMAKAIFGWKREMIQQHKSKENAKKVMMSFDLDQSELVKPSGQFGTEQKLPETAKNWLISLLLLENTPFNYLFPYEAMLTMPGIRFFELNRQWLRSLLEGALSTAEEVFDFKEAEELIPEETTGFVLRNVVVGHYPDMQIKTFLNKQETTSPLLFKYKLGDDILLCCYKGKVDEFVFSLPGQALYPGFHPTGDEELLKKVADPGTHCLDTQKLKAVLKAKDSAELGAKLMVEVGSVKYKVK